VAWRKKAKDLKKKIENGRKKIKAAGVLEETESPRRCVGSLPT